MRSLVQPVGCWEYCPYLARCFPRRRSLQEGNTGRVGRCLSGFQPETLRPASPDAMHVPHSGFRHLLPFTIFCPSLYNVRIVWLKFSTGSLWLVPLHCCRPTRQMATVHECKTNADIEEWRRIVNPFYCHCTNGKSADLDPDSVLVLSYRQWKGAR